jgi:hypothetical protein
MFKKEFARRNDFPALIDGRTSQPIAGRDVVFR